MKTKLPLTCALAVLCTAAQGYIVDGVAVDANGNLTDSSRFYDAGKGFYWNWKGEGGTVYRNAKAQYDKSKSFDFLGDLKSRITNPSAPMSPASFSKLTGDAPMCWALASANMLQYWFDDYGQFAERTKGMPLPTGFTYDEKLVPTLGGTQCLKVGMVIMDNCSSTGGDFADAIRFCLVEQGENNGPDDLRGFYYERYFQEVRSVVDRTNVSTPGQVKDVLVRCFGYDAATDTGSAKGQIAGLSLVSPGGGGHAITCYGFELDSAGNLKALYVCNPDDEAYRLEKVYLAGDSAMLYTDAACSNEWLYNNKPWSIACIDFINTPPSLKAERAKSAPKPAKGAKAGKEGKKAKADKKPKADKPAKKDKADKPKKKKA